MLRNFIFPSYAMRDASIVIPILENLKRKGIEIYNFNENTEDGLSWELTSENAIELCDAFLYFYSSANNSPFQEKEIARALNFNRNIIVVHIEDVKDNWRMNFMLNDSKHIYFSKSKFTSQIEDTTDQISSLIYQQDKKLDINNDVNYKKEDEISFTVTIPDSVSKDENFIIALWAHLPEQYDDVIAKSKVLRESGIFNKSIKFYNSEVFNVQLFMEEAIIDDDKDTINWEGKIEKADFIVKIPQDYNKDKIVGKIVIKSNGLKLARLAIEIKIKDSISKISNLPLIKLFNKKAFASYSTKDTNQVLARIQIIQKLLPNLNIFLDKKDIRSGEYWKERLKEEIEKCDIFYLFWSENAKKSEWVEKEWRCALKIHGLDIIDPVPISPQKVKPPKELRDKHFNDPILPYFDNN